MSQIAAIAFLALILTVSLVLVLAAVEIAVRVVPAMDRAAANAWRAITKKETNQ